MNWPLSRYSPTRILAGKLYHTLKGHSKKNPFYSLKNFWDPTNLGLFFKYSGKEFSCNICGARSTLLYDFPNVKNRQEHMIGLLRETLQCRKCGSTMRNRCLADAALKVFDHALSIKELAANEKLDLRILDTDSFSVMAQLLSHHKNYVRTSFIPDQPFGKELEENRYNVNLENITFADNSFDMILTSDVAEHIRDINAAHQEIYRVLKPGGVYIFTVPYDPASHAHHTLVDTSQQEDIFLVPKQLHGDPLTGGILAYRVFGQAIFKDLQDIGFSVEFHDINNANNGLFDGDVFTATKLSPG
jgi:SAM-dependent methyltransferase